MDSIVGPHIAKSVTTKKNGTDVVETPRARKYYEKALQLKGFKELTFDIIVDYTRIMMSLYSAIEVLSTSISIPSTLYISVFIGTLLCLCSQCVYLAIIIM